MPIERLGPYQILRTLGRGGMGAVYEGVHEETGERTAIKVLADTLLTDERFRERFHGEVETLKRLRHKNIVTLNGYGEEDGRLFFVMELVIGHSLDEELRAGRRFAWREVVEIAIQIGHALKHAHDHGVIHRDLKPANLLITDDGTIKLTDFGIAKFFGATDLTMAGSMIGTPDYMSPEQTEGLTVTPRSDLFSLGCVMYALLAGKPPFHGASVTKVIDRVRYEEATPIRKLVPETPAPLEEILEQLLRKDPDSRIATAQLLSNLLQAMIHGLSIPPTTAEEAQGSSSSSHETKVEGPDAGDPAQTGAGPGRKAELPTRELTDEAVADSESTQEAFEMQRPRKESGHRTIPTADDGDPLRLEAPPPKTHYIAVGSDEWKRALEAKDSNTESRREWWGIGLMALALLAIVVIFFFALQPPTADQLYAEIHSMVPEELRQDHGPYGMLLREFLKRYPQDARAAEVESLFKDEQCRELRTELGNKIRALTDLEKLYLQGMEATANGETEPAVECFQQIVDELSDLPAGAQDRRLMERTEHMLSRLAAAMESVKSTNAESFD